MSDKGEDGERAGEEGLEEEFTRDGVGGDERL